MGRDMEEGKVIKSLPWTQRLPFLLYSEIKLRKLTCMHILCWRAITNVLLMKSLFRVNFTLKVYFIDNLSANLNKKWTYHFHKNRISSQKRTSNKIKGNELELLKIEKFSHNPRLAVLLTLHAVEEPSHKWK
jgi:hypothetical protein